MAVFVIEAMDQKGRKVRKEIEAGSKEEALNAARRGGLFPTKVKERAASKSGSAAAPAAAAAAAAAGGAKPARKGFSFGGVSAKHLTQFCTQLSTLQNAGLPIVRSMRILESQMPAGKLKDVVGEVSHEVEAGSTFSDALSKHPKVFDKLFCNMIRAGEAGGVLDTILQRLAGFMEKSLRLKRKVKGAMTYPLVVVVITVLILGGIMVYVVPAFEKLFKDSSGGGMEMPAMTQVLLGTSRFLAGNIYWLIFVPVVLYFIMQAVGRTAGGRKFFDRVKLRMPVLGNVLKKSIIARFTRTLGTLLASGVTILDALGIIKETVGNVVVSDAIDMVQTSIREGESIAGPLRVSGVFDEMIVNMIEVGEETGELDKMLIKIADNYDDEVDVAVEAMTSIIEPLLIVGMGISIGSIVIALFLPMTTMLQSIGGR